MQNLSLEQRRVLVFMLGFGLGALALGSLFSLMANVWHDVPVILVLLGASVSGALGVITSERVRANPTPPNPTPPKHVWLSIFIINLLPMFQATMLIQTLIGGTAGTLTHVGLTILFASLAAYLYWLYQRRRFEQLAVNSRSKRRRLGWMRAGIWSLFVIQLCAVTVNLSYQQWPCSWADLPRRLDGCQGALRLTEWTSEMSYASDGSALAVANFSGEVSLWSLPQRRLLRTIKDATGFVAVLALAPDGQTLAAGARDGALRLWRVSDGALLHTLNVHGDRADNVTFAPDGSRVAAATANEIHVWRVADGALLTTLPQADAEQVVFTVDGAALVSGGFDDTLQVWDIAQGTLLRQIETPALVEDIAISADGTLIAGGYNNGDVHLWRLSDGALLRRWDAHSERIGHVVFSPDGAVLASSSNRNDKTVRIWRIADGTLLRTLPLSQTADSLTFMPDSRTIVASAHDDVYFWPYR